LLPGVSPDPSRVSRGISETRSGDLLTIEFRRFTSWHHVTYIVYGVILIPGIPAMIDAVFRAEDWTIRLLLLATGVASVLVVCIPALVLLLVRTTVTVGRGTFSVSYKPLARRTISFETTEFQQLYCREHTRRGRFGLLLHRYSVHAITGNANLTLVAPVWTRAHALHVEKATEGFLGLPDRYVHGGI
jgi:hypothetical protein